jgi:hypothetical protein
VTQDAVALDAAAVAAEIRDAETIRRLAGEIARGSAERAFGVARELLERSA